LKLFSPKVKAPEVNAQKLINKGKKKLKKNYEQQSTSI
jgi:hypothetical protein